MKTNLIGLDAQKAENLSAKLNTLLANYQLFYQNLRALHWNVRGREFFELHVKFEEFYTEAQEHVDQIAERILTLGETPLHNFSAYLEAAEIKEAKGVTNGEEGVRIVLENFKTLLQHERQILELAGDTGDEGSVTLMSDLITLQEKHSWMLGAWLG